MVKQNVRAGSVTAVRRGAEGRAKRAKEPHFAKAQYCGSTETATIHSTVEQRSSRPTHHDLLSTVDRCCPTWIGNIIDGME